jgi:uncharacterized membrane protein SirB2
MSTVFIAITFVAIIRNRWHSKEDQQFKAYLFMMASMIIWIGLASVKR